MKTWPSRQRGMSLTGIILLLIVVGSFGTFAVKTIPAYMDYSTIKSAIQSVLQDNQIGMMSADEIRRQIDKRFTINTVSAVSVNDLDISTKGGQVDIGLDYTVTKHFFYNIDLVMTFKRDFKRNIRP